LHTKRGLSVLALLWVLVCSGCTYLDLGISPNRPEWSDSYLLAGKSVERQRAARMARALAIARQQPPILTQEYLIGPDDELEVGIVALETPDATSLLMRTVSDDGLISLPWVGRVQVGGLTSQAAEANIRAAYAGKYLVDPQVTVTITERQSSSVVVVGAVKQPGVYPLPRNVSNVLECLSLAGGVTTEAGDEAILVRLDSAGGAAESVPIDLKELVDQGNMLLNLQVRHGDMLMVPTLVKEYVYVLGYVRRPGIYRLDPDNRVDAIRAVAMGGGLTAVGRAKKCYLIRETNTGLETVPVDLTKIASEKAPPLYLQSGDALVVGTTGWGRFWEFLAPNMGASVSASASVAP